MSLVRFADAVSTKLWENVARVNWRSFEEARAYIRTLGLKNTEEWKAYCDSGKKPSDIPVAPSQVYADAGWIGMSDWLGTDIHRRGDWRSFEEARAFVRTLGLKGAEEWRTYCRSGKKPIDIPRAPWQVYADAGWVSFNDWFGHKIGARLRKHARLHEHLDSSRAQNMPPIASPEKNQMTSRKVLPRSMLTLAGPIGVIGLDMSLVAMANRARLRKRGHSCESLS